MDKNQLPPSIPPKKNRRSAFKPQRTDPSVSRANKPSSGGDTFDAGEQMPPSFAPRRKSAARPIDPESANPTSIHSEGAPLVRKSCFKGRENSAFLGQYETPKRFSDPRDGLAKYSENGEKTPVKAVKPVRSRIKKVTRIFLVCALVLLVVLIAWPAWLIYSTEDSIKHVPALSDMADTKGETWLIAGSDKRSTTDDGGISGVDVGQRTDSLMLVRNAGGSSMIVSLPRDTVVQIPGYQGVNKLNAAFALGGPKLLVKTVEKLTGVKVNHYVQVSMGSVTQIIDAEGGVELCYQDKVQDEDSGLNWPGGCHLADGKTALAFSRMRNADPRGDFGRQERQRQVLSQMVQKAQSGEVLYSPSKQKTLARTVAKNLTTDPDTGIITLGRLAWAYKTAQKAGLSGNPPIANPNYTDGIHGSMVLLDRDKGADFWQSFLDGSLTKDQYHSFN